DPTLAATQLGRLISFVAPQVGQFPQTAEAKATETPSDESPRSETANATARDAPQPESQSPDTSDPFEPDPVNPRLVELLNNFISGARSGSGGAFGFFAFIVIVLFLFKTVEDAFNEIWGVRSGRSLLRRIVSYWTVLTLGAVLFFASVT